MKKINPISSHCPQYNICTVELPLCLVWVFIMNKQYKTCPRCEETKSISEFHKNKKAKDGLNGYCKECHKRSNKKYRRTNLEKVRERNKESSKKYRKANPEKVKERTKNWQKANPEKARKSSKKWHKANLEYNKETVKKWQKANPEYNKEYGKKYREANPKYYKNRRKANREYYKEYNNQYTQNRRTIDSLFKLKFDIRNLIRTSLRKQGYTKNSKTYNILGINYKGLLNWLNDKASNELNYKDNNVHLDHVIPISLTQTEEEILALNHYSNYQLLNSEKNLLKKNHYIYKYNLNRVLKYHPNPEMLRKIINRSNIEIISRVKF